MTHATRRPTPKLREMFTVCAHGTKATDDGRRT